MLNLVRDDYDANSDDILNSINKMLEKKMKIKQKKKMNQKEKNNGKIICNRWN